MIILLLQVIIADLTTLRTRLLFSFIPALPFIVSCFRLIYKDAIVDLF